MGLVTTGDWIIRNPMFRGYMTVAALLPQRIAIAVAATYKEAGFAYSGPGNQADSLFRAIGRQLEPGDAPPA